MKALSPRRSRDRMIQRSRTERITRVALIGLVSLVTIYVVFPVVIVAVESFNDSAFLAFPPTRWSSRWYADFFTDESWRSALFESVKISVVSMVLSTGVGSMTAWLLARSVSRARGLIYGLFFSPLIVPAIVMAIAYYFFLSQLHLVGNYLAIAAVVSIGALPLVLTVVSNALAHFDRTQEDAARTLGAGPFRVLRLVTFPQISSAVVVSAIVSFAWAFDESVIIQFVAGTRAVTLPRRLFAEAEYNLSPDLAVAGVVLVGASVLLAGAAGLVLGWRNRRSANRLVPVLEGGDSRSW
jgi:putative spermidine/putrescine transport system permease protein